jgi:adenylate cyclase
MTQATQETSIRTSRFGLPAAVSVRNTRLVTGLILFAFVAAHLANHALGLVSIDAMNDARDIRTAITRSLPGTVILLLAAVIHALLGVEKIVSRRLSAISVRGLIQIGFGLLIPILLARHLIGTRIVHELYGVNDDYHYALWAMWPGEAWRQAGLIMLVWVHGCIGIYMWIRFRGWYGRWQPWLLSAAVLLPVLAYTGFINAGRMQAGEVPEGLPLAASQYATVLWLMDVALYMSLAFIGMLLTIKLVQLTRLKLLPKVAVTYNNQITRTVPAGMTLLEISRVARVPHASMCGGKARCSTCRVQVLHGMEALLPPGEEELRALKRAGITSPHIRLACQVRPRSDLSVITLVAATGRSGRTGPDKYAAGVERTVTIMFVDIRGFTRFSEGRLPYDVLFILNQYLERMSEQIIRHGGYVDKFMGDGILAVFGMETDAATGARSALAAASGLSTVLDELNSLHEDELADPLRIGIGIHTGECILGRVGASRNHEAGDRITVLGDTVNTTSRLETSSKELGVEAVISVETLTAAGRAADKTALVTIEVRGRTGTVDCLPLVSARLLDASDQPAAGEDDPVDA